MWSQLTEYLVAALRSDPKLLDSARIQAQSVSGMLRLAEEYEATHGRADLDQFLLRHIPDDAVKPSVVHRKLLRLPWVDIFTTNYDTLLERTADEIHERHYEIIATTDDIPFSRRYGRPRIVKLHGSFPSTRPFIFTEEDFRVYPVKFAPYVNLVQQSLLENVFCLIGFSGDDPNFLQWAGWVRDRLGSNTPPLYFISLRPVHPGQERILSQRHIHVIDLSQAFPGRDARGSFMALIDWLGQRQNEPRDWPASTMDAPDGTGKEIAVAGTWARDRLTYPGWLIGPTNVRDRLWRDTYPHIFPFLKLVKEMTDGPSSLALRVALLFELNWRLEVALIPLFNELVESIEDVLTAVDRAGLQPVEQSVSAMGADLPWRADNWSIRQAIRSLNVTLLRYARETADQPGFDRELGRFNAITPISADDSAELIYQRALFAMERLDFAFADQLVSAMPMDVHDSFYIVRKAALLSELGQIDKALSLAHEALVKFRRLERREVENLGLLSREAWTLLFVTALFHARRYDYPADPAEETELRRQLHAITAYGCDPWSDLDSFNAILESPPPAPQPDVTSSIGFDLDDIRQTLHFRNQGAWDRLRPALQFRRLVDVAAFVPVIRGGFGVQLSGKTLLGAARWLRAELPLNMYVGILLRVNSDQMFEGEQGFFSRDEIATLPLDYAKSLVNSVVNAANSVRQTYAGSPEMPTIVGRLNFLFELLSRLVLRLSDADAQSTLAYALDWYRDLRLHRWPRTYGAFSDFFCRAGEALPDPMQSETIVKLLTLPMAFEEQRAFISGCEGAGCEPTVVGCTPFAGYLRRPKTPSNVFWLID